MQEVRGSSPLRSTRMKSKSETTTCLRLFCIYTTKQCANISSSLDNDRIWKRNPLKYMEGPQLRGQGILVDLQIANDRITTAYAGTSERGICLIRNCRITPYTRGQGCDACLSPTTEGITPACAGTSRFCSRAYESAWDHPRIRGDKLMRTSIFSICGGSPPHTRGQGQATEDGANDRGITPAYAGTSHGLFGIQPIREDHPRIRGDKVSDCADCRGSEGSPPHTRGQV